MLNIPKRDIVHSHLNFLNNNVGRFDRNNNSSRRSGGRDFGRSNTEMYSAVCDQCGKECKVPFKPSGDKPVYCSRCFEQQGNGSSNRFERRDSGSRNFRESRNKEMFSAVCDDCGNDCQVPFNPSSDKPIYCSKCFEKRNNSHQSDTQSSCNCDKQSEQLTLIISKLDQLITTLESQKKVVKEKKTAVKKTIKKAKKE